jgi:hypothetical protein
MRSTRQLILAADLEGNLRAPRVLAPLQHIFDPILGVAGQQAPSRWGDARVPANRFSDRPRIVFDRLPAAPADLWEGLLYHLQRRLMQETMLVVTGGGFDGAGGGARRDIPALPA